VGAVTDRGDSSTPTASVRRFRIDLSYDGTQFAGWAAQPGQRTVEAALAAVVARRPPVPGTPGRLVVAGRTDAGVHARGQVCHVDVTPVAAVDPTGDMAGDMAGQAWAPGRLVRAWNRMLAPDLRIRGVCVAPPGFDARFAASWRRYVYRIADTVTVPDPLVRSWTAPHSRELDVAAMGRAGAGLTGYRDFAAFCKRRAGATTIRTLHTLEVTRGADGVVAVEVVADAFCHSMVRALVGGLLPVGDGRRPESWPAAVLAAGVRDPAVGVAPAGGLVLEEVGYPPEEQLAARVARTRAVRDPGAARPDVPDDGVPAGTAGRAR